MFQPLNDRILIERALAETKTEAGLTIPESAQKPMLEGRILAVGPKVEDGRLVPEARVTFGRYSGVEIDDLVVVREEDVLGILS